MYCEGLSIHNVRAPAEQNFFQKLKLVVEIWFGGQEIGLRESTKYISPESNTY